jgi:hypothetical protein
VPAQDHAVEEVLALPVFDEDDLYDALDDLCTRQEKIETALYARYLRHHQRPPQMFLYDITSSYLEGEKNQLAEFGHDRDGKKGKLQIVIRLLTDSEGEPLAVRVMRGNTSDPTTVVDQIKILQEQFRVQDVIFVGDRGMEQGETGAAGGAPALHHGADRSSNPPTAQGRQAATGTVPRGDLRSGSRGSALCAAQE